MSDETEYLTASPANEQRLRESLAQTGGRRQRSLLSMIQDLETHHDDPRAVLAVSVELRELFGFEADERVAEKLAHLGEVAAAVRRIVG